MLFLIKHIKTNWLILSSVLIVIIGILSLTPLDELPAAPCSDKLHHLLAYAGLALPVSIVRPKYWLIVMLFYCMFSGAIELIQPFVNRYGEWLDMAANCSGLLLGISLAGLLRYFYSGFLSNDRLTN